MKVRYSVFFQLLGCCILTILQSCANKIPDEIRDVYVKSASNKSEVEKVVKHYTDPADSLKLKAVFFLLKNMEGLYYHTGKQFDQYLNYLPLIKRSPDQSEFILQSFEDTYLPFNPSDLETHFDLQSFTESSLIENIDMAFKVWQEQPWGKQISFSDFCEYILPFRIGDAHSDYSRKKLYERYNPVLEKVRNANGDAVAACIAINNKLKEEGWLGNDELYFLPHLPASKLIEHRTGSCRDMTDAAVYIMRAVGIPVSIDIVKQWPYKIHGHEWNVVLDKEGKSKMFIAVDQNPGTEHKPGTKKGKVYRVTYSINPESLAIKKNENSEVPDFFLNSRLKDVTKEYTKTFSIQTKVERDIGRNDRYSYLGVFNNSRWIPIEWGKITGNSVNFMNMEGDIVYLPLFYDKLNGLRPANYPLIVDNNGTSHLLKPDTAHRNVEMILTDIYPLMPDQFRVVKLWKGRIQASNDRNFANAVDIHSMTDPKPFLNRIKLNVAKQFRYFRYLPAPGYCTDLSELHFYSSGERRKGLLIGSNGSSTKDSTFAKAIDDDFTTRYVTRYSTGTWLGVDFGAPVNIDEVQYAAGINEKKNVKIQPGDLYELFYWKDNKGWYSAGKKPTNGSQLIFSNIPSNSLYIIKNQSRTTDQRPFTYENNKQVWW